MSGWALSVGHSVRALFGTVPYSLWFVLCLCELSLSVTLCVAVCTIVGSRSISAAPPLSLSLVVVCCRALWFSLPLHLCVTLLTRCTVLQRASLFDSAPYIWDHSRSSLSYSVVLCAPCCSVLVALCCILNSCLIGTSRSCVSVCSTYVFQCVIRCCSVLQLCFSVLYLGIEHAETQVCVLQFTATHCDFAWHTQRDSSRSASLSCSHIHTMYTIRTCI